MHAWLAACLMPHAAAWLLASVLCIMRMQMHASEGSLTIIACYGALAMHRLALPWRMGAAPSPFPPALLSTPPNPNPCRYNAGSKPLPGALDIGDEDAGRRQRSSLPVAAPRGHSALCIQALVCVACVLRACTHTHTRACTHCFTAHLHCADSCLC